MRAQFVSWIRTLVVPLLLLLRWYHPVSSYLLSPNRIAFNSTPRRPYRPDACWVAEKDELTTTSEQSNSYRGRLQTTVKFPDLDSLLKMRRGDFVTSETLVVPSHNGQRYEFCVKLYPRGGGHQSHHSVVDSTKPKGGFGMSYQILPLFGAPADEKVGVYLQFLPRSGQDSVDATFGLRLVGRQRTGPRFDVEWRAGMRFVSLDKSKLSEGRANDFGAHLMKSSMLPTFLGLSLSDELAVQDHPTEMQVEIILHSPPDSSIFHGATSNLSSDPTRILSVGTGWLPHDIREWSWSSTQPRHDPEQVRVGRIVVPVLHRLSQRPYMFQIGAYPGVEYRILRVLDPDTNQDLFYSRPGADYELKPIYPLVPQLERPWPVRVHERDLPMLFTPAMYNLVSTVGSLATAIFGLASAFLISQAVSFFFIPSRSMEPSLQVGDVLLVEKITPRFGRNLHVGDVVLFHPPSRLQEIVAQNGGRLTDRDLFVKRIAATSGDVWQVDRSGAVQINHAPPLESRDSCQADPLRLIEKYIQPTTTGDLLIQPSQVAVLGDCGPVSIDSRVWGPLEKRDIVGRPLARIWPLHRIGPVPSLSAARVDD